MILCRQKSLLRRHPFPLSNLIIPSKVLMRSTWFSCPIFFCHHMVMKPSKLISNTLSIVVVPGFARRGGINAKPWQPRQVAWKKGKVKFANCGFWVPKTFLGASRDPSQVKKCTIISLRRTAWVSYVLALSRTNFYHHSFSLLISPCTANWPPILVLIALSLKKAWFWFWYSA